MKLTALIVLIASLAVAYVVWPDDVTEQALAQLTVGSVMRVLGAVVSAAIGIRLALAFALAGE